MEKQRFGQTENWTNRGLDKQRFGKTEVRSNRGSDRQSFLELMPHPSARTKYFLALTKSELFRKSGFCLGQKMSKAKNVILCQGRVMTF